MRQHSFPYRRQAHPGKKLGRKKKRDAGVSHTRRPSVSRHVPLHVTVKLRPNLPSLRMPATHALILRAFRDARRRFGLRLNHYSIQSNHLHLIVEADDRDALSRGMKGLLVRLARRLNKLCKRRGSIVAERYDAHALRTPTEVRNALLYVLRNAQRHGLRVGRIDPYSSSRWFDDWSRELRIPKGPYDTDATHPIVPAESHLQQVLYRKHGPIPLPT